MDISRFKSGLAEIMTAGFNCKCGEGKGGCYCGADWRSVEEKAVEEKLNIAREALVDISNILYRWENEMSDEMRFAIGTDVDIEAVESVVDLIS